MGNDAKKYLYDILEACKLINQFTDNKTIDQYRSDSLIRSAVERQFLIIGESLQQMLKRFPDMASQITDYRNIINFRNILVHGYDRVEEDVVWGLIQSHLPILQKEAEALI
jgi:uncharacterized protein with HEPN domain